MGGGTNINSREKADGHHHFTCGRARPSIQSVHVAKLLLKSGCSALMGFLNSPDGHPFSIASIYKRMAFQCCVIISTQEGINYIRRDNDIY